MEIRDPHHLVAVDRPKGDVVGLADLRGGLDDLLERRQRSRSASGDGSEHLRRRRLLCLLLGELATSAVSRTRRAAFSASSRAILAYGSSAITLALGHAALLRDGARIARGLDGAL